MRILGIVAAISLAIVMAYGTLGTGAWFSHTDSITGNSVQAGNVTLDAAVAGTTETSLSVTNLAPGLPETGYKLIGYFTVTNTGSLPIKWRGWISGVDESEAAFAAKLKGKCVLNPTTDGAPNLPDNVYGPSERDILLWEEVSLSDLTAQDNPYMVTGPGTDPMDSGYGSLYALYVRLMSDAGNEFENSSLNAAIQFEATQKENPGWN